MVEEEQMLEEDENVDEVLEQEEQEQEQEAGEGEYLTMASILTVVPSLVKSDTEQEAKEEENAKEEEEDGEEGGGMGEDEEGKLEDKEVEEINSVDQQKKIELMEDTR